MKKVLLLVVMALGVIACNPKKPGSNPETPVDTTQVDKPDTISISPGVVTDTTTKPKPVE
jgi:hypothetical protein